MKIYRYYRETKEGEEEICEISAADMIAADTEFQRLLGYHPLDQRDIICDVVKRSRK